MIRVADPSSSRACNGRHLLSCDSKFPERRAVSHGVATTGSNIAGPILVIAGAGSGKTNTLAHRVASNIWAIAFQTFLDVPSFSKPLRLEVRDAAGKRFEFWIVALGDVDAGCPVQFDHEIQQIHRIDLELVAKAFLSGKFLSCKVGCDLQEG